jgi:hypothetical protein
LSLEDDTLDHDRVADSLVEVVSWMGRRLAIGAIAFHEASQRR